MTGQSGVISSEYLIYNIMENRDLFWWIFFFFSFHPQMKTADFGSSHESSVIKKCSNLPIYFPLTKQNAINHYV